MEGMLKFLCFIGCTAVVYGCTKGLPWYARATDRTKNEVDDLKIKFSDVVVFGQVSKNATGTDYPMSEYEGVFTIEFTTLCSYKGGKLPETIYIAGVGNLEDTIAECPRVKVSYKAGDFYVMFLKKTDRANVFEIEYKPNHATEETLDTVLDDLTINCGLHLADGGHDTCSEFRPIVQDYPDELCNKFEIPTTPAPVTTEAPVPSTKAEPKTEAPTVEPEDKAPAPTTTADEEKDMEVDVKPKTDSTKEAGNNQSDQGYDTKTEKPGKTGQTVDDSNSPGNGAIRTAATSIVTILLTLAVLL